MLKYCSIGSGSSGNCHYIGYKDTNILVDAGLSGKRITTGLECRYGKYKRNIYYT